MKGLKTILGISLATIGLSGAIAVGVVTNTQANKAEIAQAATYDYDVYVDIQGADNDYQTAVYCHNWGVEGTTWPGTPMTQVEGTLYGVNLKDSGNTNCKFDAGQDKAQTGDLTVNKHKVYLLNTNEWVDINHFIDNESQGASTATTRVFVNNSFAGNWTSGESKTMIRAWGSASYDFDGAIYDLTWIHNDETDASGRYYGYADIPVDVTSWQLVRINPNVYRRIWDYGPTGSVASGGSARIYQLQEEGWNFSWNETTGDSAVGTKFAKAIIEAYSTCSDSGLNGYGAYTNLNNNFFKQLLDSAKSVEWKSLGGNAGFTIEENIEGMKARATAASSSNLIKPTTVDNNIVALVVVSASVIAVCTTGAYLVLRKKKHN